MSAIAKLKQHAQWPARIGSYVCASCGNKLVGRPALNQKWTVCPYCGTPLQPIIYEVPDDGEILYDKGVKPIARAPHRRNNGRQNDE